MATPSETVCVLAAAGAGKTRVLTRRIAYRIATSTATAEHVLAITFTRKAAGELRDRLASQGADEVCTSTFHALARSQLRRYWDDRRTPSPTLIERKARLLAEIVAQRPVLREVPLAELASIIEWAKARCVAPHELVAAARRDRRALPCDGEVLAGIYARYEDEKIRRRLVDFDDLLSRYATALSEDRRFAAAQRWRWQHVFVDEIQDVNPLQCRVLEALLGDNRDLFVVGDPNQAIYGWNGADPNFLLQFPERWPDAEVVRLTSNHRSTPQIVSAATAVLPAPAKTRPTSARLDGAKPQLRCYISDETEAAAVATAIRDANARGLAWSDMAVLTRTNSQHSLIVSALSRTGVPAQALGAAEGTPDESGDQARDSDRSPATAGAGPVSGRQEVGSGLLTQNAAEDAVTICSFHRAKGLQWKAVWVPGLEQGLVPIAYATTDEAIAEEQRLLYVALTRAEEELYCSWAAQRRSGNGHSLPRGPSPWIARLEPLCTTVDMSPGHGLPPALSASRQRLRGHAGHTARNAPAGTPAQGTMIDLIGAARHRLARTRSPLAHSSGVDTTSSDPLGDAVAGALRDWRRKAARASGVPPFVILHDSTLELLAQRRPTTRAELESIPGIGPVKASRFGPALCGVVRECLTRGGLRAGA